MGWNFAWRWGWTLGQTGWVCPAMPLRVGMSVKTDKNTVFSWREPNLNILVTQKLPGDPNLVCTDLVNFYPRPSVTKLCVWTITASSLAYCIIFRKFQINITSSLELCTLLRFISNFVSSNYFLNFSQATRLTLLVEYKFHENHIDLGVKTNFLQVNTPHLSGNTSRRLLLHCVLCAPGTTWFGSLSYGTFTLASLCFVCARRYLIWISLVWYF